MADAKTDGERLRHLLHEAGDAEIADVIESAASIAHKASHGEPLRTPEYTALVTFAAILRKRGSEKTLPTMRMSTDAEVAAQRVLVLGETLLKVLVKAGVIRADAGATGPELLAAAEDYCR